jgi:hypothetical protein
MRSAVVTLPAELADCAPPWERYADNAWRRSYMLGAVPVMQTLVVTYPARVRVTTGGAT